MPLTATPPGGVWSGPGVSISGNTFNPTIAGVGSHKIFYNVSDSLGCTGVDTISLVVTVCTGLDEQVSGDGLRLYPNPAWDMTKLVITGKQNQDLTIELFNIYGQHVMDIFNGKPEHDSYEISVNTASLPGGIYIIKTKGKVMSNLILLKN
jgi:hypothetical protein